MQTPSKLPSQTHRLLYRGCLSLPDSHLLLDGLSFSVKLGDPHGSPALLNNPLALTLESLRGLPLHLIGTSKVKDTWIDPPGDIFVDIHPEAALTRMYFENIFCLAPIISPDGRSDLGIRVSLTENNDPDTPDLFVYAELRDAPPATASTSSSPAKALHLLAARILPGPPPPPSFRMPRPDDPTPRKPPAAFGAGKRKHDSASVPFDLSGVQSKRAKAGDAKGKGKMDDEAMRKAAAEVMLKMPKPAVLGKDARVGARKDWEKDRDVFKVPSVPVRRSASESDVFGALAGGPLDPALPDSGIEKENKIAVKKIVTKNLARHGITKTHADFKEIFNMCYHGASFALRKRMSKVVLDVPTVGHFVDAHIQIYVHEALS